MDMVATTLRVSTRAAIMTSINVKGCLRMLFITLRRMYYCISAFSRDGVILQSLFPGGRLPVAFSEELNPAAAFKSLFLGICEASRRLS